ncbi:MAG: DUF4870 domain-containing protein [Phycisphaerales bacterium]
MTWAAAMNPDMHRSSQHVVDEQAPSGERTYAVLTHLAPVMAYVFTGGILSIIAPLVMWMARRKESPFLDDHGREAVNFQLTLLIVAVASFFVLLVPVIIFGVVMSIVAAVAANRGQFYRYPMCIRLIGG